MTGTEPQAWETVLMENITYVGLDVHKAPVCVAIAEGGWSGIYRQRLANLFGLTHGFTYPLTHSGKPGFAE
jgi:hypothetical protein